MEPEEDEMIVYQNNPIWWKGYDYANTEFVYWFWETVKKGDKIGHMYPDLEEIRDWIIDHRDK